MTVNIILAVLTMLVFYCIHKIDDVKIYRGILIEKIGINRAVLITLYEDSILVPFEIKLLEIDHANSRKKPIPNILSLHSAYAIDENKFCFSYRNKNKKISKSLTANQLLELGQAQRIIIESKK